MSSATLALVSPQGTVESPTDLKPRAMWQLELEAAEKEMDKFLKRGSAAVDRFVDDRDTVNADQKWFNIYYANTNILESALYAKIPKPSVSRRYADYRDQVARVAALILERNLDQDLQDPEDQFHAVMQQAVQDRLIAGMAVAWLRFETETEDVPTSMGGTITDNAQSTQPHATQDGEHTDGFDVPPTEGGQPMKKIKDQSVITDYVHWRDFRWSPCRTWGERRWVARRVFMTKDALKKRFGEAKAKLTSLDHNVVNTDDSREAKTNSLSKEVFKKASVWEIWDRVARKVHWYAPGYPEDLLDTRDDFLGLQSFEPCPEPMLANITTSSTVPRPDYYMIQDQYSELNSVNSRISLLVQACKVVGVYDQSAGTALNSMLSGNENTMIPVPNWAQFSEKGGMKGAVDWLPLEVIVAALQRLYEARDAIKGQIYELTGISDIVRGESKASETLGAQQIKQQFASIRISKLQGEVARFASDILRIKAEMAAKHYTPDTLIRRSGIVYTDNDEWVVDAIVLLKSEAGFNWRVVVEADSMAQADYEAEKKDRIEFMSMVTGYFAQALPMAGQIPELKPIIFGMLKWATASFKGASDIAGMIDKELAKLEGKPPPPPKPDPEEMKAKAALEAMQMKGQLEQQKGQQQMTIAQQEAAMEQQKQQQELQFKQQEMELERQMKEQEMAFKREEMQLKAEENQQNLQATMQKNQVDMETHQQVAQQKVQDSMVQSSIAERQGEMELEQSAQAHEQNLEQGAQAADAKVQQMKAQAAAKPKPTKE
jgi:hypothetical protein